MPRSTRDRPAKAPLSRDGIIEAAMAILAREGLHNVSMRKVAAALDTGPASLYVYVANVHELHQAMFDAAVGEVPTHEIDPERWREQLNELARDTISALDRYPGLSHIAFAHIPTGENAMRVVNYMLGLLLAGGIPEGSAAWAADVVNLYITATAVENTIRNRTDGVVGEDEVDEARESFDAFADDRYPNIAAVHWALFTGDGWERFQFGFDLMINGLLATPPPVEKPGG